VITGGVFFWLGIVLYPRSGKAFLSDDTYLMLRLADHEGTTCIIDLCPTCMPTVLSWRQKLYNVKSESE